MGVFIAPRAKRKPYAAAEHGSGQVNRVAGFPGNVPWSGKTA